MGKKSLNFLKRRSKHSPNKSVIIVDDKSNPQQVTGRNSSASSIDELKMALFFVDQQGKTKITPIPTPPPSPPKGRLSVPNKLSCSNLLTSTTSLSNSLPTHLLSSILRTSPPPYSPQSEDKVMEDEVESTLDKGIRQSALVQEIEARPLSTDAECKTDSGSFSK